MPIELQLVAIRKDWNAVLALASEVEARRAWEWGMSVRWGIGMGFAIALAALVFL